MFKVGDIVCTPKYNPRGHGPLFEIGNDKLEKNSFYIIKEVIKSHNFGTGNRYFLHSDTRTDQPWVQNWFSKVKDKSLTKLERVIYEIE